MKLLPVVLLRCSCQHAQVREGALNPSPRAMVMVCCDSDAGCHHNTTSAHTHPKAWPRLAMQLQQTNPSMVRHPHCKPILCSICQQLILADAQEKGMIFLCPIARLRINPSTDFNSCKLTFGGEEAVRPRTDSLTAPALGVDRKAHV